MVTAMEEKVNISLDDWIDYLEENRGIFFHILKRQIRKRRYNLEYESEVEDILQAALEKMIIIFQKKENIKSVWKNTTFELACKNALNEHIRQINFFKGQPPGGLPLTEHEGEKVDPAFAGSGEVVAISPDDYSSIDLNLDLELILDPTNVKICKMLFQKFTRREIGDTVGMTHQSVTERIKKIRKILKQAGIYPA